MFSTLGGTKEKPSKSCCSTSAETMEELLLLKPSSSTSQCGKTEKAGTCIKKSKAKSKKDGTEGCDSASKMCCSDENGLHMQQQGIQRLLPVSYCYEDVSSNCSNDKYNGDSKVGSKEDSSDESVDEIPTRSNKAACSSIEVPFASEAGYQKHNLLQKNYQEDEMSDDEDQYLYCINCQSLHRGACPIHGPMTLIKDTPVPNDGSVTDRARETLPKILSVNNSNIKNGGFGVWTTRRIPKGRVFGPYEGNIIQDGKEASKTGYSWLVRKHRKAHHYIDATDINTSNWMRFVNCATSEDQQNLVAFQYQGQIYYRTYKDILPHCELMIWYGDSYAKDLGIDLSRVKGPAPLKPIICGHQCDICQRLFSKEIYLKAHLKHHGNTSIPSKYECPNCSYSTNIMTNFRHHTLTHTGEKPFECSYCNKRFSRKCNLKEHFLTHTGEEPHVCNFCPRKFKHVQSLKLHMMRCQSKEKPYVCKWCAKKFVQVGNLIEHERTHNGQKPYICPHCESRFAQSSQLKSHIRHNHKDVL